MNYEPRKIYLDDLASPQLNAKEQAIWDNAKPVDLSVDLILQGAREQTGLQDFGPDDFRERLEVWVESCNEDKGLGLPGREVLFHEMVRYLANRMKLEDLVKNHPEILNIEIDRPIMIAGLPRSGTTNLVNMIAADPQIRSAQLWEMTHPFPFPGEAGGPIEQSPRYTLTCQLWDEFLTALEHMPAIHDMQPDYVHEQIDFQAMDFSSYVMEWRARLPRWIDYYFSHDQTPHYRYEKKVLQALTWMRGPNRWVTKSPPNIENLVPIFNAFPDAITVITHRDPVAVIASSLTLLAYWDRIRRDNLDLVGLGRHWIPRFERMLRACVDQRDKVPDDQVVDVLFHEYMADQMGQVERVYGTAGLSLEGQSRGAIESYITNKPRGRHGQVVYDLSKFDIDISDLRKRFEFYYDRFGVQHEPALGE